MALMRLSPLSALCIVRATFPQVFLASILPFVPNPSLESHEWQESSLFVTMPILADASLLWHSMLNPSLLQLSCKEAWSPSNFFHVSRPRDVLRYFPSAISEYRESACFEMTMNLSCWSNIIPRQILEKDVFQ